MHCMLLWTLIAVLCVCNTIGTETSEEDHEPCIEPCTTTTTSLWQHVTPSGRYPLIMDNNNHTCLPANLLCLIDYNAYTPYACVGTPKAKQQQLVYCNSLYCEMEDVEYFYIARNGSRVRHSDSWKRVRIGEYATLHDVCLQRNGLPVARLCQLRQLRAQLQPSESRIFCLREVQQPTISVQLNSLHEEMLRSRHTNRETAVQMRRILRQQHAHLLPADVHGTAQMLDALLPSHDAALRSDVLSICSEIMASDETVLQLSSELNATNSLLHRFESYMDALTHQLVGSCAPTNLYHASTSNESETGVELLTQIANGVHALMTGNLSVYFVNPGCADITGIAIYTKPAAQRQHSRSGFWYRFVHAHEKVEALKLEPDLETASSLSQQLWQAVAAAGADHLVFKVYENDALFVETARLRRRRPRSKVLSISIPGYTGQLPYPLTFLLRNKNLHRPDAQASSTGAGCGYWNYSSWLSDGVDTIARADMLHEPIIVCQTHHLTQFSFLLGGSYRSSDLQDAVLITPLHERVLDIISIVGCCLSLVGLLGIWLTAAMFKGWRKESSTKVLLHLCLAITLQMLLFVFINTDDLSEQLIAHRAYKRCILLGAALQYIILVVFIWMLFIAMLQFQRYVTVIGIKRPRHYILKAALVAWLLPLLPTLLVACIDPNSYLPTQAQLASDTGICYPSGLGLTLGVVLPVTMITIVNLVIFVYVFYSISHSLGQTIQHADRRLVIKQIRLSVLLFFLLGLSWIFGIFAFMRAGIVFSYLFCLTATLQGFVLFVYFVLLDKSNRQAWQGLFCKKTLHISTPAQTQELQSMTTSSTNYTSTNRSEH